MPGKILASPVRELLAVAQVEPLDVVAVLRERRQRRVTHRLENQESLKKSDDPQEHLKKMLELDKSRVQ